MSVIKESEAEAKKSAALDVQLAREEMTNDGPCLLKDHFLVYLTCCSRESSRCP